MKKEKESRPADSSAASVSTTTRRRAVLGGAAAVGATLGWSAVGGLGRYAIAAEADDLRRFIGLSQRLTGIGDLDPEIGRIYLAALSADSATWQRLAALEATSDLSAKITNSQLEALANEIVAMWYSGLYQSNGELRLATFEDAVLWQVLTFLEPPTECGGEMGYWAESPAAE